MRALKTAFGVLAATVAATAFPAAVSAGELIPPGNSAVNQYTETIPTPGGHRDADSDGKKRRSPEKALGAGNTQKLEKHGQDGHATAALAAETAPTADVPAPTGDADDSEAAGGGANARGDGGGGQAGGGDRTSGEAASGPGTGSIDGASGSSGFGEVIGEATGSSSSGDLGLLLPLLIGAIAVWSVAYLMRHRRQVE
jgi:hypothetical protein